MRRVNFVKIRARNGITNGNPGSTKDIVATPEDTEKVTKLGLKINGKRRLHVLQTGVLQFGLQIRLLSLKMQVVLRAALKKGNIVGSSSAASSAIQSSTLTSEVLR